jgi:ABC-type transporter Mla subunit MlaD
MNTLKTIYDKLGDKTELAKHEVELAKIDDLIKFTNEAQKNYADFVKTNASLITLAKTTTQSAESFKTNLTKISDLATVLQKQFQELGLNYLENADVKKAVALLNKGYEVSQQAGYIKQII